MSVVDIAFIISPLQLQNPAWEVNTVGSLANNFWAMLIGFGFVLTTFFDEDLSQVKSVEITAITCLRWFFLLYGIFFIITIPLVLANTNRLADFTEAKIAEQTQAKETLITNLDNNLSSIANPQQLMEVGKSLGVELGQSPSSSADELRTQIQEQLAERKSVLKEREELAQTTEINKLWQRSIRTVIQVIIIGVICILLFFKTREIGIELL